MHGMRSCSSEWMFGTTRRRWLRLSVPLLLLWLLLAVVISKDAAVVQALTSFAIPRSNCLQSSFWKRGNLDRWDVLVRIQRCHRGLSMTAISSTEAAAAEAAAAHESSITMSSRPSSISFEGLPKTIAATAKSSTSKSLSPYHFSSPVASRKTQLRWIAQTVQKQLQIENRAAAINTNRDDSTSKVDGDCNTNARIVVQALSLLSVAKTPLHVIEAGRMLDAALSGDAPLPLYVLPVSVLERIIKATSMTGLLHIALHVTEHMLQVERLNPTLVNSTLGTLTAPRPQPQPMQPVLLPQLPSDICQDALASALRQAGRVQRLEMLLCQFGAAASARAARAAAAVSSANTADPSSLSQPPQSARCSTSLVAFNTFLAALCDVALRKDAASIQQQQQGAVGLDESMSSTRKRADQPSFYSNVPSTEIAALDRAWYWICNVNLTRSQMAVTPDVVSYATVLQAAAALRHANLVEAIWTALRNQNVSPNIVAYNARIRCLSSDGTTSSSGSISGITSSSSNDRNKNQGNNYMPLDATRNKNKQRDDTILAIWDNEISHDPNVRPDKYTIDFLLLPLIRAGRVGDVEALLDGFVQRHSETTVSNAFAAFLHTVVNVGGELATARALFETYILPTLSPVWVGSAGGVMRMVRPTARHFNVLLEGYRKQYVQQTRKHTEVSTSASATATDLEQDVSVRVGACATADEAWALYRMMLPQDADGKRLAAGGAATTTTALRRAPRPNEFTITSMMGLCRTPTELSHLLVQAMGDLELTCESVFLRAALTAYGDLGDASSALWLFSKFASRSTRTWNALLGALAKVAVHGALSVVEPLSSKAAVILQSHDDLYMSNSINLELVDKLQGSTVLQVVLCILNAMRESNTAAAHFDAPPANSQTFCVAATALQYDTAITSQTIGATGAAVHPSSLATHLFRNATRLGVTCAGDGRFVNAMLHCFNTDIDAALQLWKDEVRMQSVALDKLTSNAGPMPGKNLLASYNGLLYVCGRAQRPDIALRLVYAMKRDGLEPTEASLNSYRSGQRRRAAPFSTSSENATTIDGGLRRSSGTDKVGFGSNLERKLYESLLSVECTKYDRNDRRRTGEKRVRIIL